MTALTFALIAIGAFIGYRVGYHQGRTGAIKALVELDIEKLFQRMEEEEFLNGNDAVTKPGSKEK